MKTFSKGNEYVLPEDELGPKNGIEIHVQEKVAKIYNNNEDDRCYKIRSTKKQCVCLEIDTRMQPRFRDPIVVARRLLVFFDALCLFEIAFLSGMQQVFVCFESKRLNSQNVFSRK